MRTILMLAKCASFVGLWLSLLALGLLLLELEETSRQCNDVRLLQTPLQTPRVRLMTYNMHGGVGLDNKYDLQRIARVINSASPDILCLQVFSVHAG